LSRKLALLALNWVELVMITNLSHAKRNSGNHIRAIKRALRQRRNSAPDAKSVEQHLQQLLTLEPGELDQLYRRAKTRLRQRILTLPVVVALLLGLIWRGLPSLIEAQRELNHNGLLWLKPTKVSQSAD
jgi:hypothetical protein